MEWLVFALMGYLFYALTNIISKNVVTKHITNVLIYAVVVSLTGLIPLFLIPIYGLTLPDLSLLIISFIAGMLWVYALIPYFKALQLEEVSRVIPIWRFIPLFVLIFSFIFIAERLLPHDFAAFILLLVGGILISVRKAKERFRISRAFYLMLLSAVMFGVAHTITKFVYMNQAYLDGFILTRFGSFLAGLTLLLFIGHSQVFGELHGTSRGVRLSLVAYGLLQFIGLAFVNYAMSIGPVSLVTAAGGFQPFIVLLIAAILSLRFPNILKEELDKRTILQKTIAIAFLIAGSSLIILL